MRKPYRNFSKWLKTSKIPLKFNKSKNEISDKELKILLEQEWLEGRKDMHFDLKMVMITSDGPLTKLPDYIPFR